MGQPTDDRHPPRNLRGRALGFVVIDGGGQTAEWAPAVQDIVDLAADCWAPWAGPEPPARDD